MLIYHHLRGLILELYLYSNGRYDSGECMCQLFFSFIYNLLKNGFSKYGGLLNQVLTDRYRCIDIDWCLLNRMDIERGCFFFSFSNLPVGQVRLEFSLIRFSDFKKCSISCSWPIVGSSRDLIRLSSYLMGSKN